MELALIAHWGALTQQDELSRMDESNRQLTLQKNRFENIFATTSDLVLVTDAAGCVEEANAAARALLGEHLADRSPIWRVLSLQGRSMTEVLQQHPPHSPKEIALRRGKLVLELRIAPLSAVSLASSNYLFVLSDITGHVRQRSLLEERVKQRTAELELKSTRLEEMNVTLRNVLASIDDERKAYRRSVAHTVETTLLPTLKVLQKTDDAAVRRGYAGVLSDSAAAPVRRRRQRFAFACALAHRVEDLPVHPVGRPHQGNRGKPQPVDGHRADAPQEHPPQAAAEGQGRQPVQLPSVGTGSGPGQWGWRDTH
jgi:hypothetical protein